MVQAYVCQNCNLICPFRHIRSIIPTTYTSLHYHIVYLPLCC